VSVLPPPSKRAALDAYWNAYWAVESFASSKLADQLVKAVRDLDAAHAAEEAEARARAAAKENPL
jgi:hypothetical protein